MDGFQIGSVIRTPDYELPYMYDVNHYEAIKTIEECAKAYKATSPYNGQLTLYTRCVTQGGIEPILV